MKFIILLFAFYLSIQSTIGVHYCEKQFLKTRYNNGYDEMNVLLIWFPVNAGSQSTLRVCSNETGLPLQRHCSYDRSSNVSKWEDINRNIDLLNCSTIDTECKEENFHHYYIMKNNVLQPYENKWKSAHLTERADLQKPCLLKTGLPITRLCTFNTVLRSADWELLNPELRNISCLGETRENIVTYDLNHLYVDVKNNETDNKVNAKDVIKNMTNILQKSNTVRIPADIKISTDILKIITEDKNPELLTSILKVTDVILDTNPQIIINSENLNIPSKLLKTIDTYLEDMANIVIPPNHCDRSGTFHHKVDKTSVFYINPLCSNISGLAIYDSNSSQKLYDAHTGQTYRFLYLNESLDVIMQEPNLHLATYFPLALWNSLKTAEIVNNETVLVFIIYKNDLLFVNRKEVTLRPQRNVLEVSIQNFTGNLPENLPFIFSYMPTSENPPVCGYWNYDTWTTDDVYTNMTIRSNNVIICQSKHLTHFAALFGVSSKEVTHSTHTLLSIPHDDMLDYITILGCGLSMIGLSCIWLTAVWFKKWRAQASNQVLLNVCFVLTLLMIFFLALNIPDIREDYLDMGNKQVCKIMGASLQYIVLVLFFWMLIIAIMQYQRYVKVLGYERSSNFVIKYGLAAWGLPLIPTILSVYLEPNTYNPSQEHLAKNSAICYPSGNSLYYGVLLPMAVIMLVNLGIFIYIFVSLRLTMGKFKKKSDRKNLILQVRISVLLFFLLGISWLFGFLARLEGDKVFSYLFCITSTLQGFILFLYSIVMDKSTRLSWTLFCCGKSYNTMEDCNLVET